MFYPIPIMLYILEVALIFLVKSRLTMKQRTALAVVVVMVSMIFFQWLIAND